MVAQGTEGVLPVKDKLEALRQLMRNKGIAIYLVPSTDPHQSEYTPTCWQRRKWLSGFTGSVGDLVVTLDQAHLWTDSRYFLQAERQLAGTGITLQGLGLPGVKGQHEWLKDNLEPGTAVGVDPRVVSHRSLLQLEQAAKRAGAKIKVIDKNLVDLLWRDRPSRPQSPLVVQPLKHAGEGARKKLDRLRSVMVDRAAHVHVVTCLDCIGWLFNLRAEDVDFTPVSVAYALVTLEGAALFVDLPKVSPKARRAVDKLAHILPYQDLAKELRQMAKTDLRVWIDPAMTNAWVARALRGAKLVQAVSPIPAMKARKNRVEMAGARAAHERDGVALVRFLCWLEGSVGKGRKTITEISAAEALEGFRRQNDLYRGPSFNTISAYDSHGAIVHYGPTAETDMIIEPRGLYLVDSGGQYLDGTTDVTRTVLLGRGQPTLEQRDQFTRVLKGHIGLARCRFPSGTAGQRLDVLARVALWEAGLDYGHGTGHGVGSYLGVHEAPPSIAPARLPGVPLEVGHVVSNEPGCYRTGEHGIRIENLMLVQADEALSKAKTGRPFLCFETLTQCPIDRRLIDKKLLTKDELDWLNTYHQRVSARLSPLLGKTEIKWLEKATRRL